MPAAITLRVCEEFISAPRTRRNVRKEAAARSISHAAQFDRVPTAEKSNHRHCRRQLLKKLGCTSRVLRRHQQWLLGCLGTEDDGIQAVGCAAAPAKARHRLHEL